MQRPTSGFNQKDFEKLSKEQEKSHNKLVQTAIRKNKKPFLETKKGLITDKVPSWMKSH